MRPAVVAAIAGFIVSSSLAVADDGSVSPPVEEAVEHLQLDAFYKKYVNCGGLAIVSSKRVSDAVLLEAA